jgi:transposase
VTSMSSDPRRRRVVIGVDTHKHVHVAVALDAIGGCLDARSFAADRSGYEQLIEWALAFGAKKLTFAIEGTGSYGAGLTAPSGAVMWVWSRYCELTVGTVGCGASPTRSMLRTPLERVRPDRRTRSPRPTTPPWRCCARSRLPRTRRSRRTSAMISIKAVLVTAPPALREELQPLSKMKLINRCAGLPPGTIDDVHAAAKHTLRSLAWRCELDA